METSWNFRKQKRARLNTKTEFYCKNCDYLTMRKSSMDKHIKTAVHKKLQESCKSLLHKCQPRKFSVNFV